MKKILMLSSILMLTAVWALAQYGSSQSSTDPSTQSSTQSSMASGKTSLQGCLSGSDGNYTLADKASGTTYQLTGDTSKLQAHVGHTIEVTGSSPTSNSSTTSSMSGSADSQHKFNVTSFKHVSESCSH